MHAPSRKKALLLLAATAALSPRCFSQSALDCNSLAKQILKVGGQEQAVLINNFKDIEKSASCFFEVNPSLSPPPSSLVRASRASLLNSFNNLSGSEQQGSSVSSGGSTNAASKPSGPSALIEEFGGVNVTTGTSSFTAQWNPGTMLTNLALTGVDYLCLSRNNPPHCISSQTLQRLTPLTLKMTGNTSGGTPSVAGTAAASGSGTTAEPVTVDSKGAGGPGFTGLTVQYSFLGKKKAGVASVTSNSTSNTGAQKKNNSSAGSSADQTSPPDTGGAVSKQSSPNYYDQEIDAAQQLKSILPKCPNNEYATWQTKAQSDINNELAKEADLTKAGKAEPIQEQLLAVDSLIESDYRALYKEISLSCPSAITDLRGYYASILEAETYDDFGALQKSNSAVKPEVGLEYDLNTPKNQPSYEIGKVSFNWQFGKASLQKSDSQPAAPTPSQGSSPAAGNQKTRSQAKQEQIEAIQGLIAEYAKTQTNLAASAGGAGVTKISKASTNAAKTLANATAQPNSITITGGVDLYNGAPPASVPSHTDVRDIQAAAEFSHLWAPSANSNSLRTLIGPFTTTVAYSYQDQTAPAILTGPALSDFTGLPSSTKTAYTKRGLIHLAQAKLGFGTGSNVTYPLAFTYSNRTELITHPTWGLEFGITYNLTSLFNSGGTSKSGTTTGGG